MKSNVKFYISTEGDTDKWYFEHLRRLINNNADTVYNLSCKLEQCKSPKKFIKNKNLIEETYFHIFDYESNSSEHEALLKRILQEIKDINANPYFKDKVVCKAGYSNLSFDLWILLHKVKFTSSLSHCAKYLQHINKAYGTNFESMDKYKQEDNFKKQILAKITLPDVYNAIKYAKEIKLTNEQNAKVSKEIYGFKYFTDNPDLSIHECIGEILKSCGIHCTTKKMII
jgi:hypothetical protein